MSKKEVLTRLCALVSLVGKGFKGESVAHDCFCGGNPLSDDATFCCDKNIIAFIENAVKERL